MRRQIKTGRNPNGNFYYGRYPRSLFGLKEVNPGLISAFVVTAVLLILAVGIRVFVIPRFQYIPGSVAPLPFLKRLYSLCQELKRTKALF